jgi:hypothetical protein
MNAAVVVMVALVADDATVLRAAPDDAAAAQAVLGRGDFLEVRGEAPGFVKVWDHRRERPGYVRPWQVRVHRADESSATEAAALVKFLRDMAGFESLGIGYAALYVKVASPSRLGGPEGSGVLSGLGVMAERLARLSSATARVGGGATLAAHVAAAEGHGVRFLRFEDAERTVVCYDGDAYARVFHTSAVAEDRARAALALTRRGCLDPAAPVVERRAWNDARLGILGAADPGKAPFLDVPAAVAHRLRLRRAEALAEKAHTEATHGRANVAADSQTEAMRLLALVDKGELAPENRGAYEETAVRVGAGRWLAHAAAIKVAVPGRAPSHQPRLDVIPGRTGETCVRVVREDRAGEVELARRCTFGVVLPASAHVTATAATIAVAPLPAWTELWIFRAEPRALAHAATSGPGPSWRVDILPPTVGEPGHDIGYVEFAGWDRENGRLLVAREHRAGGRLARRFEVLTPDGGKVLHWSSTAERLRAFRWATPAWRAGSLALR